MNLKVPIIGMLHNTVAERWHPILFIYNPLPSSAGDVDEPIRHKSKSHHTIGLATREEALDFANDQMTAYAKKFGADPLFCLEKDFPWDGENIPAMVVFFGEQDGKIIPIF